MGTPVMAASWVRSADYEPIFRRCNCSAKTLYVDGETLEFNRLFQATDEEELGWGGGSSGLTARQLHSQSLLVLLLYAQHDLADNGILHWQNMMPYLLPALFNQEIAAAAGASQFKGSTTIDDTMRSMIAYSAIDEGTRPFGDSAIRALFDDANQVGVLLDDGDVSETLQEVVSPLSGIIAQYAGQLALWKDTSASGKEGVLSVEQNLLVADLSADTWNPDGQGSGTIASRSMLLYQLLGKALASASVPDPSHLLPDVWGDNSSNQFDRVAFAATKDAFSGALQARPAGADEDMITFVLTEEGDDQIQGSQDNELLAGMDGNDVLTGGGGKDLLIGGAGDDLLTGKDESYLLGGAGNDHLKAESGAVTLDGGSGNDYLEAIGNEPVTYVFGQGSGHDVLGSLFTPFSQGSDWVEQRQYDTIQLKDLSPSDLILEWDYEESIHESYEEGYQLFISRWGDAAIKILPTGDTLYLGNLEFFSLFMDYPDWIFVDYGELILGPGVPSQIGWVNDPIYAEVTFYDLNLFETADGTRYDIMSLFDFEDLTNIVQTTLPAEYYAALAYAGLQ
jgi:hypothetical protein